jgi:putative ABC transport system permease protein
VTGEKNGAEMKYFPLIWTALWRKPARTILTFLAAAAAFTLFGLAIGLNATYGGMIARARADRVYVNPHFLEFGHLTLTQRDRIARMADVREIGISDFFLGYYRDPKNVVVPWFMDQGMQRAYPELPLTAAQWAQLQADPSGVFLDNLTAARLGLKPGDQMPVLTAAPSRRDGTRVWPFHVLGVVTNPPWARGGLTLANYDFYDRTRPLAEAGHVGQLTVLLKDPGQAAAFTDQMDRTFASSVNPVFAVSEKAQEQNGATYRFNIPLVTQGVSAAGLFMILFLIANAIAQSVRERVAEFAILKTLGFSDAGVMAMVFAEAAIPCLAGALAGFAIAVTLASRIAGLSALQKMAVAAPTLSLGVLGTAFAFAGLVAFASAVIPAWRVRHLDIATALRR